MMRGCVQLRIWDTHDEWRIWDTHDDEDLHECVRIWDTHRIAGLSQFPRRFPDATFAQPQNWPAIAIFSTALWMKNLQP